MGTGQQSASGSNVSPYLKTLPHNAPRSMTKIGHKTTHKKRPKKGMTRVSNFSSHQSQDCKNKTEQCAPPLRQHGQTLPTHSRLRSGAHDPPAPPHQGNRATWHKYGPVTAPIKRTIPSLTRCRIQAQNRLQRSLNPGAVQRKKFTLGE
jgi:hypothetical protein